MSSLTELLDCKSKTSPLLRGLRQYLQKKLKKVWQDAEEEEPSSLKNLHSLPLCVKMFLDLVDGHKMIPFKWDKQRDRLQVFSEAIRSICHRSLYLETKLNAIQLQEWIPDLTQPEAKSLRLTSLSDYQRLIYITKSGYCKLEDLSTNDQEWFCHLVWVKRIRETFQSWHDDKFIYPKKGLVTASKFDSSLTECGPGLHVTLFVNQDHFGDCGNRLVLARIPIDIKDEKRSNAIVALGEASSLSKNAWKIRTEQLEILGTILVDDLYAKFAPKWEEEEESDGEESDEEESENDEE